VLKSCCNLLQFKSEPTKMVAIGGWLVTLCSDSDKPATFTLTDPLRGMCSIVRNVQCELKLGKSLRQSGPELANLAKTSAEIYIGEPVQWVLRQRSVSC